jgi:hypothetical protein
MYDIFQTMSEYLHPQIAAWMKFIDELAEVSRAIARERQKVRPSRAFKHRGATLQPGQETPLWNALVKEVAVRLRRRGDKAKLGRELGLSRQRIHQLLVERSACPDAERILLLLTWLQTKMRETEKHASSNEKRDRVR